MAFLDAINDIVNSLGEKTVNAVEAAKLHVELSKKQSELADMHRKIGEHHFGKLLEADQIDEEVREAFEKAKGIHEEIGDLKLRLEEAQEVVNAPMTPGKKVCPVCGTIVDSGSKFCPECGSKFEEEIIEETTEESTEVEEAAEKIEEIPETAEAEPEQEADN